MRVWTPPGQPVPEEVLDARWWPHPWEMPVVAPGVRALTHDDGSCLWVAWVHAESEGHGAVAAWLDSLSTSKRVVFIEVLSPRLAAMLERRGYHRERYLFWRSGFATVRLAGNIVSGVRERVEQGEAVGGHVREAV